METDHSYIPGYEKGINLLPWLKPYLRQSGNAVRGRWKLEDRKLLDYLLVYIEKGEGIFRIDGIEYQATENDLFWIPPNSIHYMEGTSNTMVCPFVHFDLIYRYPESHWEFSIPGGTMDLSGYLPLMHPQVPDSQLSELKGRHNYYNREKIGNMINKICFLADGSRKYSFLETSGILMELLAEIIRGMETNREYISSHTMELEKAAKFMKKNLAEPLSIEKIAWQAGYSESHFRKLFREFYGGPPGLYLQQIRINHAKELMAYSSFSLTKIAFLSGYETVHSFSKVFKKKEGVSPSSYRTQGITGKNN